MALNGALAGLVSITAEPLTPSPELATVMGAIGGVLVVTSIVTMDRTFKIDDLVGAISVHGVVGIWGLLAVCLSNPDATLSAQLLGIGAIITAIYESSELKALIRYIYNTHPLSGLSLTKRGAGEILLPSLFV